MTGSGIGKGIGLAALAEVLAVRLPRLSVFERLAMITALFGSRAVVTTSFGATSAAFLHLATQISPGITVLNIHHGHETPETLAFIKQCKRILSINLVTANAPHLSVPETGGKEFVEFRQATKLRPLRSALWELDAWFWLSGVMHDETQARQTLKMAHVQHGAIAIYPILDWTSAQALDYCVKHDLPLNNNYFDPCKGSDQSLECGLHYDTNSING